MKYLYTPYDVAVFCLYADFTVSDEYAVINDLWENNKRFISAKYRNNNKLFINKIRFELYKLEDIQGDLDELNLLMQDTEHSYCADGTLNEQGIIESYFKIVKLSLSYIDGCNYKKIKLKTLLNLFGYKRRSAQLVEAIKRTMTALKLKTYLKGYEPCNISEISINDMIIIRLV